MYRHRYTFQTSQMRTNTKLHKYTNTNCKYTVLQKGCIDQRSGNKLATICFICQSLAQLMVPLRKSTLQCTATLHFTALCSFNRNTEIHRKMQIHKNTNISISPSSRFLGANLQHAALHLSAFSQKCVFSTEDILHCTKRSTKAIDRMTAVVF